MIFVNYRRDSLVKLDQEFYIMAMLGHKIRRSIVQELNLVPGCKVDRRNDSERMIEDGVALPRVFTINGHLDLQTKRRGDRWSLSHKLRGAAEEISQ